MVLHVLSRHGRRRAGRIFGEKCLENVVWSEIMSDGTFLGGF